MSLRRAKLADLPDILALESYFGEHERWTQAMWTAELGWPDRRVIVVTEDAQVIGAATFQLLGDVADLHRIVVRGSHQRHGLASRMLADGIGWARCSGAERVLLEVRADNVAALALYAKHGFVVISERQDYYAPGSHALVLELPLSKEDL